MTFPIPRTGRLNCSGGDKRGEFKNCSRKINIGTNSVVGTPPTSPVAKAKIRFLGYEFAVPIFANRSVSQFEVNEGNESAPIVYDNDGKGYVIPQGEVIYLPWLSTEQFTSDGTGLVSNGFTVVAGVNGFYSILTRECL